MKILSAKQIRDWDAFTIANEPVSSIDLMERAASACTRWLEQKFENKTYKIFCGTGNNGGDGLAIARQLAEINTSCEVFITGTGSEGSPDFLTNLERLHTCPVTISTIDENNLPAIAGSEVVVDALFGSGLNRPLEGTALRLVDHINTSWAPVVSIDLPSGLNCDQPGRAGNVIRADYTLTFQAFKLCFMFPENEVFTGETFVLDIGLHQGFLQGLQAEYELTEHTSMKGVYKPRKNFSHKGTYGHALIIAGEKGKMGAAVMSTRACLRSGAGLVTAIVPSQQFNIIQTSVPEAMALSHAEVDELEWGKYNAIGIGPGIGTREEGSGLLQKVLSNYTRPIVVDADALNLISINHRWMTELPPGSILSPHPKEFERLFGKTSNQLERIQTAKQHAQQLFIYIILKGHYTALACPDGEVYFNGTGNPGMATAGSGDVLTGMLTGLLAQGYSSKDACLLGLYLHGLAGDLAARSVSQEAMIAGDITSYLGKAYLTFYEP